jgi:CspA family cold shock protein
MAELVKTGADAVKMFSGTVKWFNLTKGFGFIEQDPSAGDGNSDIFFHKSEVEDHLTQGTRVTFNVENSPKGQRAVKVKKAQGQ